MSFGCIFEFFSYISHLLGSTGDILFYFLIFFCVAKLHVV